MHVHLHAYVDTCIAITACTDIRTPVFIFTGFAVARLVRISVRTYVHVCCNIPENSPSIVWAFCKYMLSELVPVGVCEYANGVLVCKCTLPLLDIIPIASYVIVFEKKHAHHVAQADSNNIISYHHQWICKTNLKHKSEA